MTDYAKTAVEFRLMGAGALRDGDPVQARKCFSIAETCEREVAREQNLKYSRERAKRRREAEPLALQFSRLARNAARRGDKHSAKIYAKQANAERNLAALTEIFGCPALARRCMEDSRCAVRAPQPLRHSRQAGGSEAGAMTCKGGGACQYSCRDCASWRR